MKQWLEYEISTGQIVCLLTAEDGETPYTQNANALIEPPEEWDGDIDGWRVADGTLVRTRLTVQERLERERERRERAENAHKRIIQIKSDFVLALLDDDADAQAAYKAEYRRLKARL